MNKLKDSIQALVKDLEKDIISTGALLKLVTVEDLPQMGLAYHSRLLTLQVLNNVLDTIEEIEKEEAEKNLKKA